jgi:SAM-dependent methyltransferase
MQLSKESMGAGLVSAGGPMAGADRAVADSWSRGDPYERYMGRWSRRVAPRFLAWLAVPPGLRWLDVGCGTGALSQAILEGAAPASLVAVDASAGFLEQARANLAGRATLHQATAGALPLDARGVDVCASGLLMNFVPDPVAALREMARVTSVGGLLAAYVWDYPGQMDMIRIFWEVATELDPSASALDEARRFPLCRLEALHGAFVDAGLNGVTVTTLEIETPFADFDDYWAPFLGGQGPAPSYAMSLEEPARQRLREQLRKRIVAQHNGSIALTARALAVRGTVPDSAPSFSGA